MKKGKPKPSARTRIAVNLRRLRTEKGLSQEWLCMSVDISQTYFSQIESAKRNVTIDIIERIAKALEVDITELLRTED
ncbi:helix-turn-helix domain-containing protein [Noviherbaspirillum sp.]|uniref:helix-turn-helix domain-containing protein n=1 Tax=Noviherbaspirillum sp. TaxID=1926288 RepID=UPI002FE1D52B